jgi:type IV pilus assembly protein PilN
MIKINLSAAPKPKRGKGKGAAAAGPAVAGEGMSPVLVGVLAAVVGFGVVGYLWYQANTEKAALDKKMAAALQENARLAEVKNKYLEAQRQAENYKHRVDVIDQLKANQSGPMNLLNMIGDTVNNTDAVWLGRMNDNGTVIQIEGQALSANAVANLVKNLQKTGFFKSVELVGTEQDPQSKDVQTFVFTLNCEKQTKS